MGVPDRPRLLYHARRARLECVVPSLGPAFARAAGRDRIGWHAKWTGQILQRRSRIWVYRARWRRLRCFCACPRRRGRRHEDIGSGSIARIRGRPRAGWPLKGRQPSLAREDAPITAPSVETIITGRIGSRRAFVHGRRGSFGFCGSSRPGRDRAFAPPFAIWATRIGHTLQARR
jgi:hypothetical protein